MTRVLVDTSPDLREQLLDAEVDRLDAVLYTHEHADHTHGIDDLRALFIKQRRRIDVYLDAHDRRDRCAPRFGYCFESPPGSEYPPILREHPLIAGHSRYRSKGRAARSRRCRVLQEHGDIPSLGFRFGNVAYSCDLSGMPAEKRRALDRPRCLDRRRAALPAAPQPFLLDDALGWIERLKPQRAILTNMHADLDYEVLRKELPPNVEPAFDGMSFSA